MGEVVRHSFGENINFENLDDPVVRRLMFFAKSPSVYASSLYECARQAGWSRSQVLDELTYLDRSRSSAEAYQPGTGQYLHRQWLESIRYDPVTYEILEDNVPEEVADIGDEAHDAARDLLDGGEGER